MSDYRTLIDTLERLESVEDAERDLAQAELEPADTVNVIFTERKGSAQNIGFAYDMPQEVIRAGLAAMREKLRALARPDFSRAVEVMQMGREPSNTTGAKP